MRAAQMYKKSDTRMALLVVSDLLTRAGQGRGHNARNSRRLWLKEGRLVFSRVLLRDQTIAA